MDITDQMLRWNTTDLQLIDEYEAQAHWDFDNPNGGNAQLCGDPNTDLVTLLENHFGELTDKVLNVWANTFWSLLDQYGAQGAFEFILAYRDPTNSL